MPESTSIERPLNAFEALSPQYFLVDVRHPERLELVIAFEEGEEPARDLAAA